MSCFQIPLSDVLQYLVEWTCNASVVLGNIFLFILLFIISWLVVIEPFLPFYWLLFFIHGSWRSKPYEFPITAIPAEFQIHNYLELIYYLN